MDFDTLSVSMLVADRDGAGVKCCSDDALAMEQDVTSRVIYFRVSSSDTNRREKTVSVLAQGYVAMTA
jgi:hypothetical protein